MKLFKIKYKKYNELSNEFNEFSIRESPFKRYPKENEVYSLLENLVSEFNKLVHTIDLSEYLIQELFLASKNLDFPKIDFLIRVMDENRPKDRIEEVGEAVVKSISTLFENYISDNEVGLEPTTIEKLILNLIIWEIQPLSFFSIFKHFFNVMSDEKKCDELFIAIQKGFFVLPENKESYDYLLKLRDYEEWDFKIEIKSITKFYQKMGLVDTNGNWV